MTRATKSFVKKGKGLGLAKRVRKHFEDEGYSPMAITHPKLSKYPAETLGFPVHNPRGTTPDRRFPGSVFILPDGIVLFEGKYADELRAVGNRFRYGARHKYSR